jgi:nitrate reductase assembly molybdenum cofactor insertion protein NarJ
MHNKAIEAQAFIFDLLSVSFAYPTEEMYQSLLDGRYADELIQRVLLLPKTERLTDIVHELEAFSKKEHAADYNAFESEYISLFEYNKDAIPLHPNAHLYSEDEPQPVPVYQRLKSLYRDFDIEIDSGKATEKPDHLSVQLEFFAYLHRLLLEEKDARGQQKIKNAIRDFCIELEWTHRWTELLRSRPVHAFYRPLAEFMLLMFEMVCSENNEFSL